MSQYYNLKVKEVIEETPEAITIRFKQPLFRKVKYKAGQFLTLITNIDGTTHRRSYSMCSTPNLDSDIAVTVKRLEGGLVSNYLNDNLEAKQSMQVMEPMGNFIVEPNKELKRHIVLIGAGSGITPLMSILRGILFFEPESQVSLLYGNRKEESVIYGKQLQELKEKFADRFELIYSYTQPSPGWGGFTGRIDEQMVVNVLNRLPKTPPADTHYFLCGPAGVIDAGEAALKRLKVNKSNIHHESFYSTTPDEAVEAATSELKEQLVKIIVDGETHEVMVPPSKSILDAGLDEGVDMPFSCQSGVCTACRGRCLTGKVQMVEGDGLSAAEIEEGYVLTCVGHPLTDNVVVEIG
jgi:ring-1,2-phenylacetyl-CoA epoxidase subunit PaaE